MFFPEILVFFVVGYILSLFVGASSRSRRGVSFWRCDCSGTHCRRRIKSHDREPDVATVVRNSPIEPRNEWVRDTDWVVALGLNKAAWRVTDPDDGTAFITDDVGIAIDNLADWGCTVAPIEQRERLEPWLRI